MEDNTFVLVIESLSYGGRGVGRRSDGKVVFVPGVIPGETVLVSVVKQHPSFINARIVEVLKPSPSRQPPRCMTFDKCGGCDWQHMPYEYQVKWKQDILLGEISKINKLTPEEVQPPVESIETYGYRRTARIQCKYINGQPVLGFFMKRSHRIVSFEECPVLAGPLQVAFDGLRCALERHPLPSLVWFDMQAPKDEVLISARLKGNISKDLEKSMYEIFMATDVPGMSFTVLGDKRRDYVFGQRYLGYTVDVNGKALEMVAGFGSFMQANHYVNTKMIDYVALLAGGAGNKILDLYSGGGNFSIPLASLGNKITAIDRNPRLVAQGKRSARLNDIYSAKFICMDSLKAVKQMASESITFDTVILDPPREGARDVSGFIPGLNAERIIYVSCNPLTLGRDLSILISRGYRFKSLKLFDMFPHSYHIESIAFLQR
ncbi:MAG: hypothetical protein DRG37_07965 [Deltaproteobacteria bacterium]|nr:MAG: hypothetical protein DRG37_07965 [Deltaproteobacteria bacterium]